MALTSKLDAVILKLQQDIRPDLEKIESKGKTGAPGVRARKLAKEAIDLLNGLRKDILEIRKSDSE